MANSLNFMAVMAYIVATVLTIRWIGTAKNDVGAEVRAINLTAVTAVILHFSALITVLGSGESPDLALGTTLSAIALLIIILFLITSLRRPLNALGVLVLPAAAIATLTGWLLPGTPYAPQLSSIAAMIHLFIAGLSYALLSLAVAQSILLLLLEKLLREKHPAGFWLSLPPIETMETLLFELILSGFILLTITLISGGVFSDQLFGRPFIFNHHATLAILAWLSFGVLLTGHRFFGWRGRTAVNWTLASFVLLVLGYFGTRFVLEVVLSS